MAQKYISKIMDEEVPSKPLVFDQVNEVDEETEREQSPTRTIDQVLKPKSSRNNNIQTIGLSYYETSDSDSKSNERPLDQSHGYDEKNTLSSKKLNSSRKSRLSQLSKFNLFALIELGNACLIIKLQKDLDQALQI